MNTPRPGHVPMPVLVWSFVRRDFAIARSYRLPFAMDIVSTVMVLVTFFFLARLVDRAEVDGLAQLEAGYFPFVLLGLALLRVVQSSLTSFTTKLRTEQTTGTLEALLASQTPPTRVILGSAAYDVLRATTTATLMVALGVGLGLRFNVTVASLAGVVVALPALLTLFGALGIAVAAFTIVFKQAQGLLGLVVSGLALLGGVYFPVELFPRPLYLLSQALPFTWGLDVLRAGLLAGQTDPARLGLLVVSALVTLPVALWLFVRAVDQARRRGTLAQY